MAEALTTEALTPELCVAARPSSQPPRRVTPFPECLQQSALSSEAGVTPYPASELFMTACSAGDDVQSQFNVGSVWAARNNSSVYSYPPETVPGRGKAHFDSYAPETAPGSGRHTLILPA